jgi:hypothetical protein
MGCDDDGLIPGGSTLRKEFYKRVDELVAVFGSPDDLLVQHTLPDATIRECSAEVLDIIDFTTASVNPKGLFNVSLVVPGAFWQDNADKTNTFSNPTVPSTLSLTNFAGATAPMDELTITITGPITNPKVEVYRNGAALDQPVSFQYNGSIGSGNTMIVNCKTWTLSGSAGATYANFSHAGDARWLSVSPAPAAGTPQVRLTGSGNTATTAISFVGRRKFLVG